MSKIDLAQLLASRNEAWARTMSRHGGHSSLNRIDPRERLAVEKAASLFRRADEAIVAALRYFNEPVVVVIDGQSIELRLTADRLNFVQLDPATGDPIGINASHYGNIARIVHRYPRKRTA